MLLALTGVASAAPTAQISSFKVQPVPIFKPVVGTYPLTGNIFGAGAALRVEYTITGSGYGYGVTTQGPASGIPPISQVNFFLPAGAKINANGFGSCSAATLKNIGPRGCTANSFASPVGHGLDEVTFGTERVPEEAELRAFFAPGGGLLFYTAGHSPVSLEFVSSGNYVNSGKAPYGLELITQAPAITTVPGAPLASTKTINIKVGSAYVQAGRTFYYLTLPRSCPEGGFPFKTEVTFGGSFGGEREFGIPGQTATATYKSSCPTSSVPPEEAPAAQTPLPGTGGVITAPSNKGCVSRRHFVLHMRHHPPLVYRRVTVELNGRQLDVIRERRISADIDLRGLPKGLYTVRISVVTTTGQRISGTRAYHTCAPKPIHPKGKAVL
jgi:hypothetical protein